MEIKLDQIVHSRRKSIAIIIQSDGRLLIRAPMRLSNARIREFVLSKADWILTQQAKAAERKPPVHTFTGGDIFLYLGRKFPLEIVDDSREMLTLDDCFRLRRSDQHQARLVFQNWYKKHARQVITDRVNFFATKHAFSFSRIRLSSARTRWGSCNSRGTLSFTWRLVMAPIEIIDYVVIHELVHLEIQNHSASFWKKVHEYMPDYKKRRSWLKENGFSLNLDA